MTKMATTEDLERFRGDPRSAMSGKDHFATGSTAKHRFGVLYKGPWETLHDGTCKAVRLHARCLAETGVPVLLQSYNHTVVKDGVPVSVFNAELDPEVERDANDLNHTDIETMVPMVKHLIPRNAQSLRTTMVPRSVVTDDVVATAALIDLVMRSNVVYTVWECDKIPSDIAEVMSRAGRCWVPCHQNQRALIAGGVPPEKVEVIPHPYEPSCRLAQEGPRRDPIAGRRFLSIGIWQPRKGQHELLGAFLRVFKPSDDVSLTIKTTRTDWPGYPTVEESVRGWLEDQIVQSNGWSRETMRGRVSIKTKRLREEEIENLHLSHNIYVSAGHGEAWCLPAFDSKMAGNSMIHVPFGGTADFCDVTDLAIPYALGDVHESYHWQDGARWAVFAIEDLEEALRVIEAPQKFAPPALFEERFSFAAVGQKMRESLLAVAQDVHPEAALYLQNPQE